VKMERRNFLKMLVVAAGAASVLPRVALAEERRRGGAAGGAAAGGELPLVEPGKGMAKSLNYVHQGSQIKDPALKTERQGVPFAKQDCKGCQFYTANGKKGADDVGKCSLFPNQVVKSTGWCSSWAKKA